MPIPSRVDFCEENLSSHGSHAENAALSVHPRTDTAVVPSKGRESNIPAQGSGIAEEPVDWFNTVVDSTQSPQKAQATQPRPTAVPFSTALEVSLLRHYVEHLAIFASISCM